MATSNPEKKSHPYLRLLRWLLAAAILGYVVYYLLENREQLESLKSLSPAVIVLLTLLTVTNTLIYSVRFQMIVQKKSGVRIPFGAWLKFFLVSRFLSLYAGQAGNLYRAAVLKSRYQVSITKYISSMVFISWFDTCLGLLLGTCVIAVLSPEMKLFGISAVLLILGILIVLLAAPVLGRAALLRMRVKGKFLSWVLVRLTDMMNTIAAGLSDVSFMKMVVLTWLVAFVNNALAIYIVFRGIGFEISVTGTVLFFTVMMLCNRLVITPGNIGVREFAYGLLSEQLHIGMAQGLLVSLITRVIMLLTLTVMGIGAGGLDAFRSVSKQEHEKQEV